MRDFRDAVRALRASRGSTTVALILLTVGIGAGSAVFSVADAVLRGLPFADADRLVVVSSHNQQNGGTFGVPPQDYLDWKAQQDVFADLGASVSGPDLILAESGPPESFVRTRVTTNLFSILGVQPRLGRPFTAAHEQDGNQRVLLLSDALWRRRFGGDPGVIGRTMAFEGGTFEILGVMPPGFTYPPGAAQPADAYSPYVVPASQRVRGSRGRSFALTVVGRLKDGVSLESARARMEQIHGGLAAQIPDWFTNRGIAVIDLRESLIGRARPWMLLLIGAVVVLLLLVCANVSALALARGLTRAREIGVRAALGASRMRIVRSLAIENAMLCAAGAGGGAILAYGAVAVLRSAIPASVPQVTPVAIDARVLAAAGLAALATAVLCSVIPAWRFSRADVAGTLRAGRTGHSGTEASTAATLLVTCEIALSVILLVGAGLFVSSFNRLMRVDLGLDYRNVLTVPAHVRFSPAQYPQATQRAAVMLPAVLERVRSISGVESAALIADGVPLSGGSVRAGVRLPGRIKESEEDFVDVHRVSPGYFEVLRIPLMEGRVFSETDSRDAPGAVILNASAARMFFPIGDAVGSVMGFAIVKDSTVIGVVGDLRLDGPERPVRPEVYVPLAQAAVPGADLVVRTASDPMSMAAAVKSAIWSVEPGALIPDAVTLETRLARIIAPRQFNMLLFGVLGILAAAIAMTGIYGLLAQQVAQREHEIGLRMALGALPSHVMRLVVGKAARCLLIGLALGCVIAWSLTGLVQAFLFESSPGDPRNYVTAGVILVLAGLLAAIIPTRRALQADPLTTLKA